jgi:hypothetical protein
VGNLKESAEYIDKILEVAPEVLVRVGHEHAMAAATLPLFARVTGTTDQLDVAESTASEILSTPSTPHRIITAARAGLALIATQWSDTESAKEHYSLLQSERGTQPTYQTFCADRILGLLAQAMGNLDDSQPYFEDALAICRKAGYVTELAGLSTTTPTCSWDATARSRSPRPFSTSRCESQQNSACAPSQNRCCPSAKS